MTSRKDILETEAMLSRLQSLGFTRQEAESLRRISMSLQRWFEAECGNSNDYGSWAIVRGRPGPVPPRVDGMRGQREFIHDDDGTPFMEWHHYQHGRGKDYTTHTAIPDREAGARKRLAQIVTDRNARLKFKDNVVPHVQTDPRGCAVYIVRCSDIPRGESTSTHYTRGVAVFK